LHPAARTTLPAAIGALCLGLILGPAPVEARGQGRAPPEKPQVSLLLRALGYDERLTARAGLDIHIGIVGRADDHASARGALAVSVAFQSLGNVYVQGLPVKASQLEYGSPEAFAALLERRGIDVVYVCAGLERDLPDILAITRKRQVLSIGSTRDHVGQGASLGALPVEGALTLFVNLAATRAEGAAFPSSFLRLARVIR
jgi:hypothetical protein